MSTKSTHPNKNSVMQADQEAPNSTERSWQTILLAVTGMSPAVLTETIWALAHEVIPIIPDRVVIVTTLAGRQAIERELFTPTSEYANQTIWDSLRNALSQEGLPVKGRLLYEFQLLRMHNRDNDRYDDLADIRNPDENRAAADFLIEQVRNFSEIPDTRIIASIAGGRKTMGALLYACMSLQAREDARLTHVLVNEPFDGALTPKFYYPAQPVQEMKARDGQIYIATQASIQMADLPFVPMRNLFERDLVSKPRTFIELVNRCRHNVADIARKELKLKLFEEDRKIQINQVTVQFSSAQFVLVLFLARLAKQKQPPFGSYKVAVEPFSQFAGSLQDEAKSNEAFNWRLDPAVKRLANISDTDDQQIRKLLSEIKEKLQGAGQEGGWLASALPEAGRFSLDLSPGQIKFC